MNKYRDQLEGTGRLFRIRRIKRVLLAVLLIVLVVLSAYAAAIGGAGLKPPFLPIRSFLPLVLVLLFIAGVANLIFRSQEIRHARRDSQRYLIVKSSLRRSFAVIVVTGIVGAILIVPYTAAAINANLGDVQTGRLNAGDIARYSFTNQDAFGVTRYLDGRIRVISGGGASTLRIEIGWVDGPPPDVNSIGRNTPLDFSFPSDARHEYNVTIENVSNQALNYEMTLHGVLMPELTTLVPAILLAYAVVNFFWIAYASPLRQKYASGSIYSVDYREASDMGSRTFADYYRAPRPPTPAGPPAVLSSPASPRPVAIRPALAQADPPPPMEPIVPAMSYAAPESAPEPEVEPEITPEQLMEEGSKLFSDGQHEAALVKFDAALEIEPENVLVLLAGAAALLRLGRRDEAIRQYDQVLRLDQRNPKALQEKARVFEGEGRWVQAAEWWASYSQAVPNDVDARLRRAECILNAGDRGGAVKALEEALFLAPSDPRIRSRIESLTVNVPALLSRALVASASGQYEGALSDFDTILSADPDNVNALVGKGVALRRAKRTEDALAVLEVAIAKQPGNSAALRSKGAIHEERGDFEKALDVYEDLLEWNPRDPELWALQGAVLEKLGEQEEALASYHEALKIDPSNSEWKARASALESSRKGAEAFLEELFSIKGVGPQRARALLSAGYKTIDALRNATEEELANVRGMSRKAAEDIFRHFHPGGPPPPPEAPAPMQ
ncbi:MAG TPA: tetratricopeptide repeat protein [Thermoplasmata archaeon]|nr:tetratricopeptide repeat protein [Thermoplasmata archaeon]